MTVADIPISIIDYLCYNSYLLTKKCTWVRVKHSVHKCYSNSVGEIFRLFSVTPILLLNQVKHQRNEHLLTGWSNTIGNSRRAVIYNLFTGNQYWRKVADRKQKYFPCRSIEGKWVGAILPFGTSESAIASTYLQWFGNVLHKTFFWIIVVENRN